MPPLFMESALGIKTVSLAHKKIILGVTGGIAAYKAAELCRLPAAVNTLARRLEGIGTLLVRLRDLWPPAAKSDPEISG